MRRRSKNQLQLSLREIPARPRAATETTNRELVAVLAELLLNASRVRREARRRASDERKDHR